MHRDAERCKYCLNAERAFGEYRANNTGYVHISVPVELDERGRILSLRVVLKHRYVMEQQLGRALRPDETVHHINGIRDDNDPGNLQLRQGQHGAHVAYGCLDCGSQNVEPVPLAG